MSSNSGISLEKIPGTSTISNDIDFISNPMVNYNSQKLYDEFLSNLIGSKFLSNNLVNRSACLLFFSFPIPHFRSDSYYRINKRGSNMFSAGKSRERRISSSCWSWPGERCSIEISPIHTSLGIQVSKILIIFMYNIYLSLISRNSNPIERDLINIYIYILQFPLFEVPARNTTDLRSI